MTQLCTKGGKLFAGEKEVLRGWESFSGWYWFATEIVEQRLSEIGGKPVRDTIFFGFVQGLEEEWGYFSLAELESLAPMVWEILAKDLPHSGRRHSDREVSR